jgi:hypothetical protein
MSDTSQFSARDFLILRWRRQVGKAAVTPRKEVLAIPMIEQARQHWRRPMRISPMTPDE